MFIIVAMVAYLKNWRGALLCVLIFLNIIVYVVILEEKPRTTLNVYFLDIGQGDAIFFETPSHGRVLIDGGPNRKVLSEIGRILPFWDRRIDVVIETHPDRDHIGGLPEVISRYKVGAFMKPGVESDNSIDDELEERVKAKNIPNILARRGTVLDFGDGVKLIIYFPNSDVSGFETNDASIVAELIYGESEFLFTGDAELRTEDILLAMNKSTLDTDVLKAGHHGSRTSTSLSFLEATTPEYTIISAGLNNSYGHPHKEVINSLEKIGTKILKTFEEGTIEFETDGKEIFLR